MSTYTWADAIHDASTDLGHPDPGITRTIAGIRPALRTDRRTAFDAELSALSEGGAFDVFLDHWWTQALQDTATDEDTRETALAFADLAVSLRIAHQSGPTVSAADIEELAGLNSVTDVEAR